MNRNFSPLLLKHVNEIITADRGLQAGRVDVAAYQLARAGHAPAEIEQAILNAAEQLVQDDGLDRVLEMIRDAMADGSRDRVGAALELAAHGIPIFPARVIHNGQSWKKLPLFDRWQEKATTDLAQIGRWWAEHPSAVPAIWCGHPDLGLVGVDVDRHDGGADGVEALADMMNQYGAFAPHPITQTPGGGFHHIFRQPSGVELGNTTGDLPQGIDIRGKGGYIIAPGSVRPDGKEWKTAPRSPGLSEAFQANSIPELPDWLVERILRSAGAPPRAQQSTYASTRASDDGAVAGHEVRSREINFARGALRRLADELSATKPGDRNNKLYKCAFRGRLDQLCRSIFCTFPSLRGQWTDN
jgi:Bifunctional DNA primase/polymerase, N-terminal